jgi:hypothetical protein
MCGIAEEIFALIIITNLFLFVIMVVSAVIYVIQSVNSKTPDWLKSKCYGKWLGIGLLAQITYGILIASLGCSVAV